MLIHTNCNSMRKSIGKIFKKKIIEGCIQEVLLDQCICGKKELLQVYITIFGMRRISLCSNIELHFGCILESCFDCFLYCCQEYFPFFLSLSEYLLACKEQKAREFGICIYSRLFEEFVDTYSRQEVSKLNNNFICYTIHFLQET